MKQNERSEMTAALIWDEQTQPRIPVASPFPVAEPDPRQELELLYRSAAGALLREVGDAALHGLGLFIFAAHSKGDKLRARELEALKAKVENWIASNP
jgi:hypothetical protein